MRHNKEFTELRVNSPFATWSSEFSQLLLSALFFVLGQPLHPAIQQNYQHQKLRRTIYSATTTFPKARHQRPFCNNDPDDSYAYADMVDKYLRYILVHPNPRFLWAQINAVYEASAAQYIDAWALTLSVVIESFVNSEFEDIAQPSELEKQWVDALVKHLDEWESPEEFAEFSARFLSRAKGSLSGIKQARINDRLRALEGNGAIAIGATKAWTELRNGTAHSYQRGKMKDEKMRSCLAILRVMFYHIFFHAIRYQGPFTDFSSSGWPVKNYPSQIAE